jgi:hypothetical protein
MVEIETGLAENTAGAVEQFAQIASADPISAVLLLCGAALVAFSAGIFGVLTLGAVGSSIKRGLSGPEEPNQPA